MSPPPPLDTETPRERILTGGGGAGTTRGSLTRAAGRYRDFVQAVWTCARLSREQQQLQQNEQRRQGGAVDAASNDEDADAIKLRRHRQQQRQQRQLIHLGDALQAELLLHDLEIRKLVLSSRACDRNSSRYATTLEQMQKDILATRRDIEGLASTLVEERRIRHHREEYNALARIGNESHPPIRVTKLELEKVQREVQGVKEEVKRVKRELGVRERQMRVLMQSVEDLKSTLREESFRTNAGGGGAGVVKDGKDVGNTLRRDLKGTSENSEKSADVSSTNVKKRKHSGERSECNDDVGAL